MTLTVTADLEIKLELQPRNVNFGNVQRGDEITRTVALAGPDAGATKVVSAKFEPTRARPRGASAGGDSIVRTRLDGSPPREVEISMAPNAPAGRFAGRLVIHTDHPQLQELTIGVQGTVRGSVTVQPDHVSFIGVKSGVPQTRTLTLAGSGERQVEILGVESDNPALTAAVSGAVAGRTTITVTCDGTPRQRQVAKLIVRTSSTDDPEIEVPVIIHPAAQPPRPAVRPSSLVKPKPTRPAGD